MEKASPHVSEERVYAHGHEVTRDHDVTITSSRGWTKEGAGDQPPASERASTRADDSTPVDELLELAEDAAAASSVEPATECILSSSLDVHCDRLRRSWPASLYDCRMRFARDVLRQRLRTWCSCAPPQYTAVVTRAARYATQQRSPQRLRYRSRAARSPPKLSPQSLRRRRRRRSGAVQRLRRRLRQRSRRVRRVLKRLQRPLQQLLLQLLR